MSRGRTRPVSALQLSLAAKANRPTAPRGILLHRPILHRQRLLIIRRDAGIQPDPEHFRPFPCLAKNVSGFYVLGSPFSGHFSVSPKHDRSLSFPARQDSSYSSPLKLLAVVPRHPLRWVGHQFLMDDLCNISRMPRSCWFSYLVVAKV